MNFTIPASQRRAVEILARLDPAQFEGLVAFLESRPLGASTPRVEGDVARIATLESSDAKALVEFLAGLCIQRMRTRDWAGVELSEFVRSVSDATVREELEPAVGLLVFGELLTRVLNSAFGKSIKAVDVLYEQERLLQAARVITDIRPVFEDDPSRPPYAALLIHTLRIEYHDTGANDVRSIEFVMDSEDVRRLARLLDRATAKTKSLQAAWRSPETTLLVPPTEDDS